MEYNISYFCGYDYFRFVYCILLSTPKLEAEQEYDNKQSAIEAIKEAFQIKVLII